MSGRAALLLVLAGAALLALWMWQGSATDTAVAGASAPVAAHGYSATNAVLVQTDDKGNMQYRVTAARIDRANPTADVILTLPTFDYSATGAGLWKMTAQRGIIPAGTRQIDLSGNVIGHGHPEGQPGEIHMATQQLHVDMEQEIATSQTDVDMNWRGSRLRGHGMHADLKGEKLVLESGVKGLYVH